MKHANLFDTDHPLRKNHDEDSTSGDKNNNTLQTKVAAKTQKITPLDEAILKQVISNHQERMLWNSEFPDFTSPFFKRVW